MDPVTILIVVIGAVVVLLLMHKQRVESGQNGLPFAQEIFQFIDAQAGTTLTPIPRMAPPPTTQAPVQQQPVQMAPPVAPDFGFPQPAADGPQVIPHLDLTLPPLVDAEGAGPGMGEDVAKEVKISPETLGLEAGKAVEVTVENTGRRQLAYKLKTTRPISVKPTKAFGVVKAGGNDKVRINFRPTATEKPFSDTDRVTILVAAMSDLSMKPDVFWKSTGASDPFRQVLKLEKASEGGKKEEKKEEKPKEGKKEEKKEEASEKSEESEAETESSGTVSSDSSGTESEA